MTRAPKVVLAAALTVVALGATACGGAAEGTSPSTVQLPTAAAGESGGAPPSGTALATTGGAAPSAPTTVGRTISDPVTGTTVRVQRYVVGYQPSASALARYGYLAGEEIVLVQVAVSAGSRGGVAVGATDFRLGGEQIPVPLATTPLLNDEIGQAGYPPLREANPGGSTSTGWLVFTPNQGVTTLQLRFLRRHSANSSGGDVVAAKTFSVDLTTD